eukprot:TRINITY_DN61031_c0_g1_i1.p1 TRINITY_DN61031_c0_g1~~TRINITY_DN61031_c0_g1_i1.p1  ORF type:complete len:370 (+),score=44.99 TRINITY_DN61031_c0_g1_i1:74-1183(+)
MTRTVFVLFCLALSFQPPALADGQGSCRVLLQSGVNTRSRSGFMQEARVEDHSDYSEDILAFLSNRNSAVSCDLPRASLAEANRTWSLLLEELGAKETDIECCPWRPDKEINSEPSILERARMQLADRLFGGAGIVEGATKQWTAMQLWEEESLKKRLAEHHFMLERYGYPNWIYTESKQDHDIGCTLTDYLDLNKSKHGYFLFVNEQASRHIHGSVAAQERNAIEMLQEDFQPHPVFAATPDERHSILALDGLGSGHALHWHDPVWQAQVQGRKAWWIRAPSVPGHKTETNKLGHLDIGAAPVIDGKIYQDPNACAYLYRKSPPPGTRLCIAAPGDLVLLPGDYMHATCALDRFTASVGGWMKDRRKR